MESHIPQRIYPGIHLAQNSIVRWFTRTLRLKINCEPWWTDFSGSEHDEAFVGLDFAHATDPETGNVIEVDISNYQKARTIYPSLI